MDSHPLTDDERKALQSLARTVLHSAADANEWTHALAWAEAACACLGVLALTDRGLHEAGRLLDLPLGDAPFAGAWNQTLAPIAARAEALLSRDVERDVDDLADRLSQP